jgi:RNA recognition motif-containing protein
VAYSNWDAFDTRDSVELMIGGTRYEMVELPDSMMSTTLWVGNLCEFVTDEMLSELFQRTSSLKFVPACVARKPNYESMKYGFVTFRSEEEKEVSTAMAPSCLISRELYCCK